MENFDTVAFAGGCFWCTEAVFRRIKGVSRVISGYTGGTIKNPAYREVCTGRTGHAEAILIDFDPRVVALETLMEIFFATHDPTTLNRQGNDTGTQYRSAIFYKTEEQHEKILTFIELLGRENVFREPIVTEVNPLQAFYEAEEHHQEYYEHHKAQPYCQVIIDPKIKKLEKYYSSKLKDSNAI